MHTYTYTTFLFSTVPSHVSISMLRGRGNIVLTVLRVIFATANTGGHALRSMIAVSRAGFDERCTSVETRLPGVLNVFLSVRDSGVPPPSCDVLYSSWILSASSVFLHFGLSLRCELDIGKIAGRDMARFLFRGAGRSFEFLSDAGVRGLRLSCEPRSDKSVLSSYTSSLGE